MTSAGETSETVPSSELITVQDPLASWLLGTFQRFNRREVIGVALIVSGVPFVVSGAIAFQAGFFREFLTTGSVYIWTAGLFGGGLTFGWWAKRYPELWTKLRPVFDEPDSGYRTVVRSRITAMYDLRRALLWFPAPLIAAIIYDLSVGITVLIDIPEARSGWVWVAAINYTFGIVSLLGFVIAINVVFNHLRLVSDSMELRLQDVQTAAAELTPLARFNTVISAGWFVTLTAFILLLEITPAYTLRSLTFGTGSPLASAGFLIVILLGFVLFVVPQYSIHAGITSEKLILLNEMDAVYDELYEDVSNTAEATDSLDQVSVQLDVLEARRRNAKESQTWAYDWPGVISIVATSVVPILSLFV